FAARARDPQRVVQDQIHRGLQDDEATLSATDAWLAAHEGAAPALRRLVLEARDDLARTLRGQACDAAAAGH
ncbi:hypothetical protein ABZ726_26065, partial [Streptomyces hundungensis]|uniref:hypothetical protein n=1 Tax=Streptomyces hundungensis TaxID=1077946 RepID=UPI0033E9255F